MSFNGKLADPEWRAARARKAAEARSSEELSASVRRVIKHADRLTEEQRKALAAAVNR